MSTYALTRCQDEIALTREHPDAIPPIYSVEPAFPSRYPGARELANAKLSWIWPEYLHEFPQSKFIEILYGRYNVGSAHVLTLEMLDDLFSHFRNVLMTVPRRSA